MQECAVLPPESYNLTKGCDVRLKKRFDSDFWRFVVPLVAEADFAMPLWHFDAVQGGGVPPIGDEKSTSGYAGLRENYQVYSSDGTGWSLRSSRA